MDRLPHILVRQNWLQVRQFICTELKFTMLGKQLTKIVQNLEKKKFREKYHLFKIEGEKLVEELLHSSFKVHTLIASPEWITNHAEIHRNFPIIETDSREMKAISNFQSPPSVIALAEMPAYRYSADVIHSSLSLVLNGIQDPGNLGTILRVADWFSIRHVFCDKGCAGAYNPKCVQASMGAIFRVKTLYVDIAAFLSGIKNKNFTIFGTFLDGEDIYNATLSPTGIIVMGNEGQGIDTEIEQLTDRKLTVPGFARNEFSTESLNVGVATGIVLSEFKRRTLV